MMSNNLLWVAPEFVRMNSGSNNIDRMVRELVRVLESLSPYGVKGILNAAPANPKEKDKYIVGTAPSGLWAGKANHVAVWDSANRDWEFAKPVEGQLMTANGSVHVFDGSQWLSVARVENTDNVLDLGSRVAMISSTNCTYVKNDLYGGQQPATNTFVSSDSCYLNGLQNATVGAGTCGLQDETATTAQAVYIAAYNCAVGVPNEHVYSAVVTGRNVINPQSLTFAGGYSALNTGQPDIRSSANRKYSFDSVTGRITSATQFDGGATFNDYAEYFENKERGVIPLGSLVALDGRFARLADTGDDVVGVVSGTGCVTSGDTRFTWAKRFMVGEFGELLYQAVEENGVTVNAMIENPEYDSTQENIPRSNRPDEWTCVGLVGQIHARIDGTVNQGDWIAAKKGTGTKSESKTNIRCMEIKQPYDKAKGYGVGYCLVK